MKIPTAVEIGDLTTVFDVPYEDALLILLNSSGIRNAIGSPRTRLFVRLATRPTEPVFLILSFERPNSPFEIINNELFFQDENIGEVFGLENDDALLGYFRNARRALTLNSNARSQCTGCVFCPNSLEHAADPFMKLSVELDLFFNEIARLVDEDNISFLENIAVVTGCFCHEEKAIEHLLTVDAAARRNGFDGTLRFLSSVIRSPVGFRHLASHLSSHFHYSLTVECAEQRELILKASKASLQLEEMPAILGTAKSLGFDTDFTYIVGLDTFETARELLSTLIPLSTTFPLLQVYQPHTGLMQQFVSKDATTLDYYLLMRNYCELLLQGRQLRPIPWQNYRPLWYYAFDGEGVTGCRK